MTLAQEGAATHVCCGCKRDQSALAFRHCSPKEHGGWYDTEGVRRRPCCRTCLSARARRYRHNELARSEGGQLLAGKGYLPVEPFRDWVLRKRTIYRVTHPPRNQRDHGLSAYLGIENRRLWDIIEGHTQEVSVDIVERALLHEGSTMLWELYGDLLYPDEEVA